MTFDISTVPERLDKMTIKRLGEEMLRLQHLASYTAEDAKQQSLFRKADQCRKEIMARRAMRKR